MLVGRRRELETLAASLESGKPGLLLGEAGIGKSVLLRAAGEASGRRAFHALCLAGLSWYAYLPIARAVGAEPPWGDPAHVADWLLEEVADGMLVLDDLHWADTETVALLPHLVGRVPLLAAIRRGDPGTAAAVAACADAGFSVLDVNPLPDEDARRIVIGVRDSLSAETVDRIVGEAGGSPLLLEELAHGNGLRTLRLGLRARLSRCSPAAQRSICSRV